VAAALTGGGFVVIALDDGTFQFAHGLDAFLGKGVVADDVTHANVV
jgi:hypothetical protein